MSTERVGARSRFSREPPMAVRVVENGDADLVRGHLGGCLDDTGTLYLRYFPPLVGLCQKRLRERAAAEDLAQETLLRAFAHLRGFDRSRPLWPWLKAVATNLMVDYEQTRS